MNATNRQCDRCGQPIETGVLRYEVKIQVYAAYDPLEITFEDLTRDHSTEITRLVEQCQDMTQEELMRDVYVQFRFDLCRSCQRAYVAKPVAMTH